MMEGEDKNSINQMELLFKISNDVASIMSDLRNFQTNYNSDKEDTAKKIEDVRKDCEKEVKDCEKEVKAMKAAFDESIKQQDAQIKLLTTYIEALRTQKDKEDAKKWRTVIAFIFAGLGGMLLSRVPDIIMFLIKLKGAN